MKKLLILLTLLIVGVMNVTPSYAYEYDDSGTVLTEICFTSGENLVTTGKEADLLTIYNTTEDIFFTPLDSNVHSQITNTSFDGTVYSLSYSIVVIEYNTSTDVIQVFYNSVLQSSQPNYCLTEVEEFAPITTTPATPDDLTFVTDNYTTYTKTQYESPFYSYYYSDIVDGVGDLTGFRQLAFEMPNEKVLDLTLFEFKKYDLDMNYITSYDAGVSLNFDFTDVPVAGTRTQTIVYEVLAPSLLEQIYFNVVTYDGVIVGAQYVSLVNDDLEALDGYVLAKNITSTFENFTTTPHENINFQNDTTTASPFLTVTYDEIGTTTDDLTLMANTVREINPMISYNITPFDDRDLTTTSIPDNHGVAVRYINSNYFFINTLNGTELPSITFLKNQTFINNDLTKVVNTHDSVKSSIASQGFTEKATYIFSVWREGDISTTTAEGLTYTFISTIDELFFTLTLPNDVFIRDRDYRITYYMEQTLFAFQDTITWVDSNTGVLTPLTTPEGYFTLTAVQNLAQFGDIVTIATEGTTDTIPLYANDYLPIEQSSTYEFQTPLTLDDRINDVAESVGLASTTGKLILSVVLMLTTVIGLAFIKTPMYAMLMIILAEVSLLAFIGFIPLWVILAFGLLTSIGVFLTMKGGGKTE